MAKRLSIPVDVEAKVERVFEQLENYEAACFWCGYGYKNYTAEAEDEHFAHHCPDAPEQLRQNARKRLLAP